MKLGAWFSKSFRNNIVVGLVLVAPLVITGFIIHFLIKLVAGNPLTKFVTELLFRLFPEAIRDGTMKFVLGQFISILLVVMGLFLIGFFVRSYLGRHLYRLGEKLLVRIPVFNKVYIQIRHISETIFSQRQTMFKEVVLVEYPRKGLYSLAFVTSSVPAKFAERIPHDEPETEFAALFIPTTPNPTSGLLILAPRADLVTLTISVSDAMKLIISGGAVYPGDDDVDNRPTLLDKLETWIARETKLDRSTITPDHE